METYVPINAATQSSEMADVKEMEKRYAAEDSVHTTPEEEAYMKRPYAWKECA